MLIRRTLWLTVLAAFFLTSFSCIQQRQPRPPVAMTEVRVDTLFGVERVDDYYWLRQRGNPEVIKYLEEENEYTASMMKPTERLQERLYNEMVARTKETDLSVPEKEKNHLYYERTEKGKQYKIICRKKDKAGAAEEILLDINDLAKGYDYFVVGNYRISPDEELMAYSVDTNGSELFTVYFKNLETGQLLSDRIPDVYYPLEWGNDDETIFYTVLDEALRPYQAFRHKLGTDHSVDQMVFHEEDQAFELYLSKTKSDKYLLIELESMTTSEVHYLDAGRPDGSFKVLLPRRHQVEYSAYHHDNKFYIVTNDNAPNFKVITLPTGRPEAKFMKEFIAHNDSVKIDGLEVFRDYIVSYERKYGLKQMRIFDLGSGKYHYVKFPEPVYTFRAGKNRDFRSNTIRFTYTSLVTPKTVFDYNMGDKKWTLKKQYEVLGGFDESDYVMERLFAMAADSTLVPISLVYRKDLVLDGNNPALLYGYGSYGSSSEPWFNANKLSLIDRGFVYAIAHVRGGGEMGRYWYDQGKLLNKMNTFTDFIACAEHLADLEYTSPEKLVISGGSAGGLLIGAVLNMRPNLFAAAVAGVPFVDVVNTMLDASIPLTVIEYEEWGNPNEKEYFDYMLAYSPYDNVRAQDYPAILVTAGLNDPRVQYWEPAKWTARLRALKTDENLLLLKTNMGAGHFGVSGRYDEFREDAFEMAFILNAVGIDN